MKLFPSFQNISMCAPNRGNSVLFWADVWIDQPLKDKFPQLFSFTRKPKCSIKFFLNQQEDALFSPLPLPPLAAEQLDDVYDILHSRTWDETLCDSWLYTWGSSVYSSKKAHGSHWIHSSFPFYSNGCGNQAT